MWRWLREPRNGVGERERQEFMRDFMSLVYTTSTESLDRRSDIFKKNYLLLSGDSMKHEGS